MRGSKGTIRRYLGIAGLAALSVPAVVTISREIAGSAALVTGAAVPAAEAKRDRTTAAPRKETQRPDTAWVEEFAALRTAARPQASTGDNSGSASPGGDVADPAAAGPASGSDLSVTTGAVSPRDGQDPGHVAGAGPSAGATQARHAAVPPAQTAPTAAGAAETAKVVIVTVPQKAAAAAPQPSTGGARPGTAAAARPMLPPVPDPESHLAQRLIEGRRPVVIVTVPPEGEARPDAVAHMATPGEIVGVQPAGVAVATAAPPPLAAGPATAAPDAVDAAVLGAAAGDAVDPTATASIPPAAIPTADEAPSADAAAIGGFAPAPWLRITSSVPDRVGAVPAERARPAALPTAKVGAPIAKPVALREASARAADPGRPELGYAPASAAAAPFDALLGDKVSSDKTLADKAPADKVTGAHPKLPAGMHDWAYTEIPAGAREPKEQKCLAEGIYFESRGESERGQAAVAQVILNRLKNPAYPKTICGVVYQNRDWWNRCQFSFACDGLREVIREPEAWETAKRIAEEVSSGKTYLPDVADATHYHATWVAPGWRREMTRKTRIGVHVFYRTVNGGWN